MRKIPLTHGKFAVVDDEDYEALSRYRWHYGSGGDARRNMSRKETGGKRRAMLMHRQIMNAPPGKRVDHLDGDSLNNRRANLRVHHRVFRYTPPALEEGARATQ